MMKCHLNASSMVADNDAVQRMSVRLQRKILDALGSDGYELQAYLSPFVKYGS